jgi:large conductance mechanosensitive channel
LVDDIVRPPIGVITGGVDFSNLFIPLNGERYDSLAVTRQAGAPTVNIGLFINNVISFLVAFVLFMVIKAMNQLRRKQEEEPQTEPPPSREVQLLEEIRDALVKR